MRIIIFEFMGKYTLRGFSQFIDYFVLESLYLQGTVEDKFDMIRLR